MTPRWRISTDTGGTFTDCWALDPAGTEKRCKILSSGALRSRILSADDPLSPRLADDWGTPDGFFAGFTFRAGENFETLITDWDAATRTLTLADPLPTRIEPPSTVELTSLEPAPVLGARLLTGTPLEAAFPALDYRLGTTIATNALLERKGAPTAFFVTRGFRDLLRIRDQRRPDLFALEHRLPRPLHSEVIEVDERLDARGNILTPFELSETLQTQIARLRERGIRSAAIALLHSYLNPTHEKLLAACLREAGFEHLSLSSELAPFIKLLPRAETAVADAAVAPVFNDFIHRVESALFPAATPAKSPPLLLINSAGGLETSASCHAVDALLSGPAAGVVGAAAAAGALGHERILTFDMGGTSTDVARYDRDYLYRFEQHVGDASLLATALNIHTVAAGGGSICRFDPAIGLTVGPESAGANPGPACYGAGGPLTVTDVNLLLRRIDPKRAAIPLDPERALTAFDDLLEGMGKSLACEEERHGILEGLLTIAVERMADAIRTISIRDGADPADYALVAFGGAGPLHACAVAEQLGITTIIAPGDAGLLSAFGLHHSALERFAEKQVLRDLTEALPSLADELTSLEVTARKHLEKDGAAPTEITTRRRLAEIRLRGQDSPLTVEIQPDTSEIPSSFAREYETIYGYPPPANRAAELVSLRVVASLDPPRPRPEKITGPLAFADPFSTLHLAPGWEGASGSRGSAILTKPEEASTSRNSKPETSESTVEFELFRNRFDNIVTEMGARLQRSALSTNIKERADFSCALLDARGRLVVNAPHIPVHLGALGLCLRTVLEHHPPLRPGDMLVTNHPAFGGSHLPDVTVLSPVFAGDNPEPLAYVANRAHHAEIGGIAPGSMPPDARSLAEEGVVIAPTLLVEAGTPSFEKIEHLLRAGPHPSRSPSDNLADLEAQAAANRHGVRALEQLVATAGRDPVEAHLQSLTNRSREALHHALKAHPVTTATALQHLDDGTPISLTLTPSGDGKLHFDFTGSGDVHPGSLNATPAVVRSAILYALRLFTRSTLPLNEGLIEDVTLTLPEGFLNPPFSGDPAECPAVVGGNVETSQRLVDTLLLALHLEACSQGTMNNLIFGDDSFGYYETIAGGSGAGPTYPGTGPLQVHMTNTAITDPEILEHRYPVRLREFSVRHGSGGSGRFPGGDGAIREFEFLAPLSLSLLTEHRESGPYGMEGGNPGLPGKQTLTTPEGASHILPHSLRLEVQAGTILRIETPGGGGYGGRH